MEALQEQGPVNQLLKDKMRSELTEDSQKGLPGRGSSVFLHKFPRAKRPKKEADNFMVTSRVY